MLVKGNEEGKQWLLTGFYGNPEASKREGSWELLKSQKPVDGIGWCTVGDFNEIVA